MKIRAAMFVALPLLIGACSGDDPESSGTTSGAPSTSTRPDRSSTSTSSTSISTSTSATDTSIPASTVESTTTTTAPSEPLDVVAGRIAGLDDTPTLGEAKRLFGGAVPIAEVADVFACTGTEDPMVIRTGGLTLVFERTPDQAPDAAILTNWRYVGGSVGNAPGMTADGRLHVGDSRRVVLDLYGTDVTGDGDELDVRGLRIGLEGDVVAWFGRVECVFEEQPTAEPASAGATARRGG